MKSLILNLKVMMRKRTDLQYNSKRQKLHTEPNESIQNKQNLMFKSDGGEEKQSTNLACYRQTLKPDCYNQQREGLKVMDSTIISPTFQSLSVKDQIYKETYKDNGKESFKENGYPLTFGFSLRDLQKSNIQERNKGLEKELFKLHQKHKALQQENQKLNERCMQYEGHKEEMRQTDGQMSQEEDMKAETFTWAKLEEHYRAKDYWLKLQKMLKEQGKDIRLMRELELVTTENKRQRTKRKKKEEEILLLKQEIELLKNQKHSQSHPSSTIQIQQLQNTINHLRKEYSFLQQAAQKKEEQSRILENANEMQTKEIEQIKQSFKHDRSKYQEQESKYKELKLLHQEVERKRKQLSKQLDSANKEQEHSVKQINELNKKLNNYVEQLKQIRNRQDIESKSKFILIQKQLDKKYQQLALEKIQEYQNNRKQEIQQLKFEQKQQIKKIIKEKEESLKINFDRMLDNIKNEKQQIIDKLKKECFQIQTREQELKNRESRASREVDKLFILLDEAQKNKIQCEMQLSRLRKNQCSMKQSMKEKDVSIQQITTKNRQLAQQLLQKQTKYNELERQMLQREEKQKYNSSHRYEKEYLIESERREDRVKKRQDRIMMTEKQLQKTYIRTVKDCIHMIKKLMDEINISSKNTSYRQNELSQEHCIDQLFCIIQQFDNDCRYVIKQNEILSKKNHTLNQIREGEKLNFEKELTIKEDALKTITAFIPEQHKDIVLEFLCLTEQIAYNKEIEGNKFHELKDLIREEAKLWKEFVQKMDKKIIKLEEENEEFRRRYRTNKKDQDGNVKKEIRKRYDL